jgi:Leucine-rich repeat (LRR) protein
MAVHVSATPDSKTDNPPRRRRWVPLSLRMFAAILLVLGLAGIGVTLQGHRQLIVIREIERLGGGVATVPRGPKWLRASLGYERSRLFDNVDGVGFRKKDPNPILAAVGRLSRLKHLNLDKLPVTDEGLSHLESMTNLEQLWLNNTRVTDSGLKHLRGLTQLQWIWMNNTKVTDAGLAHLKGLKSLTRIWIANTEVTDEGLKNIRELSNLNLLWLANTNVTDSGLVHLGGLEALEELSLEGTKVTDEGVAELERRLPRLTVRR